MFREVKAQAMLCSLIDLDPLVLETMQGQHEPEFPVDVGLGAGTDGGAVKCNAVFSPPDITISGTTFPRNGTLLTGVIPYATVAEAALVSMLWCSRTTKVMCC